MLASLPPDPGMLAYLRQLDLDVLLLDGADAPGSTEADYLIACRALKIPSAAIHAGVDSADVPAGGLTAIAWRPLLWALLAWDVFVRPSDTEPGDEGPRTTRPAAQLEDVYARNVYPALASVTARLAPAKRPLLKQEIGARLDPGELKNQISAEGVMAAAAEGRGPIILGPWWGEPELEILYWIPFLRWWRRRYQVDKDRLVAISNGAAAAWYDCQHLDLDQLFEADLLAKLGQDRTAELAARNKRFGTTAADRQILKRMDRRLGFRGLNVVPPWTMAVSLEPYWSGVAGPALLTARTRALAFKIKEKHARRLYPDLPAAYVVMGAARDEQEPPAEVLQRAAETSRLVILHESGEAEWAERAAASNPRIQAIALDPASAKGVASTVLAAAEAYVGPQNWMAHVAAALGRPAICLRDGAGERQLIDQAAAARLFSSPPILLDPQDVPWALDRVVARRKVGQ